jgi:hypothetical protein
VFLPIGSYSIGSRAIAFKNLSFFPFLYFIGRFVDKKKLNMNKIFSFILIILLIACLVAMTEKFFYQHLHTLTGYSGFNAKFFQTEETGSYGLQWTFETENGLKRFGSIFSNPLEFAAEPEPPKIQIWPSLSTQALDFHLEPGLLPSAGSPFVP